MVFGLLHHPPRLDALNLTFADVNDMEESTARMLWDRLQAARERTVEASKRR